MDISDRDVCLQTPKNTRIASQEESLVVSGVFGTKTIRGAAVPIARALIEQCDGTTPLGDLVEGMDNAGTAVAEKLCEDGILYPISWLASLDPPVHHRSLFESVLLSTEADKRDTFAENILSQTIAIRGDEIATKQLASTFRKVGWTVDTDQASEAPDIILYAETTATKSSKRTSVNNAWLDSDSVLVRVASESDAIEVGPLLTTTANACLECLATREAMNTADNEFEYETVNPGSSYDFTAVEDLLLGLICRVAAGCLPPEMVGVIKRIDLQTLEQHESSLLGVPGCEYCGF